MVNCNSEAEATAPPEVCEGTVLVVEDEALARTKIIKSLVKNHFRVIEAHTGEQAMERFEGAIDLVVLDILLPGLDGFEVCRRMRARTLNTPIIMLTTLGEIKDRLRGLDLGADDYMVKPFYPQELVARVRAVLRRSRDAAAKSVMLEFRDLKIDFHAQKCFKNGHDLDLTPKEFQLLDELCANRGTAVSRQALLNRIRGENRFGSDKSLDVYIGRLRQKIEDDPEEPTLIRTVRGFGYLCG